MSDDRGALAIRKILQDIYDDTHEADGSVLTRIERHFLSGPHSGRVEDYDIFTYVRKIAKEHGFSDDDIAIDEGSPK